MISILQIGSITTVHPFATLWPSSPKVGRKERYGISCLCHM